MTVRYSFDRLCNPDRLSLEIQSSEIAVALSHIQTKSAPPTTDVFFKAELPANDEAILGALVEAHVNEPLPDSVALTQEGFPIVAPFFRHELNLMGYFKGYQYSAPPNVTSIFDVAIVKEIKVEAGWYEILDLNASIGDYIEFSVVDKDDVLGLFGAFNLEVGVDVLEVHNLVRTEYVNPRSTIRNEFRVMHPATVLPGLYFRVKYKNSSQSNSVDFKVSYLVYEE